MKSHQAFSHRSRARFGIWLRVPLALGLMLASNLMWAADPSPIVGDWEGTLDPGAQPKQRIVVHIAQSVDGVLSGTIDYPDKSTSGILITAITYKELALHFESSSIQALYDGSLNKDNSKITGTWQQTGASTIPLILQRAR